MKKLFVFVLALAVVGLFACKPKKTTTENKEAADSTKKEAPAPDTTQKTVDTTKKVQPNTGKKTEPGVHQLRNK